MKRIIKCFVNLFCYKKWIKKATLLDNNKKASFYRSTQIVLCEGASKKNIVLDAYSRIHGTLLAKGTGYISVGKYSQIGPGSIVVSSSRVEIGDYTSISTGVIISDTNTLPINPFDRVKVIRGESDIHNNITRLYEEAKPIIIGQNCWLGENSCIYKGVTIGKGSIVAANAVVTSDVPENCIVAGNPARIVKTEIDITTKRYFK